MSATILKFPSLGFELDTAKRALAKRRQPKSQKGKKSAPTERAASDCRNAIVIVFTVYVAARIAQRLLRR